MQETSLTSVFTGQFDCFALVCLNFIIANNKAKAGFGDQVKSEESGKAEARTFHTYCDIWQNRNSPNQ